ncbi:MAG: hypothetical protein ACRCVJ_11845 [Clostridium sp.]|uniref:hypothetical protein n=1 Tax=Clostridium sp. TaxID=1506 RepID=UPI003F3957C9
MKIIIDTEKYYELKNKIRKIDNERYRQKSEIDKQFVPIINKLEIEMDKCRQELKEGDFIHIGFAYGGSGYYGKILKIVSGDIIMTNCKKNKERKNDEILVFDTCKDYSCEGETWDNNLKITKID